MVCTAANSCASSAGARVRGSAGQRPGTVRLSKRRASAQHRPPRHTKSFATRTGQRTNRARPKRKQ
eukprot:717821-Prymnesium_polylepis.1